VFAPVQNLMLKLATTLIILLASISMSVLAAPVGYSINSDSPTGNADSLYRIDLGTGTETRIASINPPKIDVEGLAFAPDRTLYAVDDETRSLFPLDPATAAIDTQSEAFIAGLPSGGQNDFGMTFACDGNLYVTSIARGSLYRLELDGSTTLIGSEGSLNPVKIGAIAAWGSPVQLYGLGSGANSEGQTETPNLYRIDLATGVASEIGPLGGQAGPYLQGGLSFDDAGELWAITEGAQFGWPSQIMKIDPDKGTASAVRTLVEEGFESLAIAPPGGCDSNVEPPPPPPPPAPPQQIDDVRSVPTMDRVGLAIASILLLLTGLLAVRRV
jgi:hypothetical protein